MLTIRLRRCCASAAMPNATAKYNVNNNPIAGSPTQQPTRKPHTQSQKATLAHGTLEIASRTAKSQAPKMKDGMARMNPPFQVQVYQPFAPCVPSVSTSQMPAAINPSAVTFRRITQNSAGAVKYIIISALIDQDAPLNDMFGHRRLVECRSRKLVGKQRHS